MDNVGLNNNINANMPIIRKVEKEDVKAQNTSMIVTTSTYKPTNLNIASSKILPAKVLYSFFDNKDVLSNKVVGAYFDKIDISPSKDNIGLSGNAILPQISFDQTRNDQDFGRLDIPSVYMGGNSSNKELDAGLSWDKVYTNGQQTFTNDVQGTDGGHPEKMFIQIKDESNNLIGYKDGNNNLIAGEDEKGNSGEKDLNDFSETLQPNYAFRPFWRTTNTQIEQLSNPNERQEVKFKDGNVNVDGALHPISTNKAGELVYKSDNNEYPLLKDGDKYYIPKSTWHNPSIDSEKNTKDAQNVYFYPGQNISMSIQSGSNGDVSLNINTSDNKTNFKQNFYVEGFGKNTEQSFKAVNSIDQFTTIGTDENKKRSGLEGLKLEVLPTSTKLTDASWQLNILKKDGTSEPANNKNSKEFRGADTLPKDFKRSVNNGIHHIDITPDKVSHNNLIYIKNTILKSLSDQLPKQLINKASLEKNVIIQKSIDEKINYLKFYLKENNINVTTEEVSRFKKELSLKAISISK